jgi:hypothetical protein
MKISQWLEIFQAGKAVTNPEFWKQKTINANVIMVLISGVIGILNLFDCGLCDLQLTTEQIIGITTGITTIVGIFNAGSTAATSEKVGLIKKKPSKDVKKEEVESETEELTEVSADLSDDIEKLQ